MTRNHNRNYGDRRIKVSTKRSVLLEEPDPCLKPGHGLCVFEGAAEESVQGGHFKVKHHHQQQQKQTNNNINCVFDHFNHQKADEMDPNNDCDDLLLSSGSDSLKR